ncbi:MAG: phosphate ABC transporter permease subunit PstC [Burkholderiales bacterium]|nr:phosphate ABC transporter permease subunit PstC [Opitutaceae bacterium]
MPSETTSPPSAADRPFRIQKARTRFLGLTLDECIQGFFGGNAFVAVIVLALITLFLFREGSTFFAQNRDNLTIYRQAGLEYVDFIRQQEKDHSALTRYLSDIRLRALRHYTDDEGLAVADANARLAAFDEFAGRYSDAVLPVRDLLSELGDVAVAVKERHINNLNRLEQREQLLAEGKSDEAAAVQLETIDFGAELSVLTGTLPLYEEASAGLGRSLTEIVAAPPALPTPALTERMARLGQLTADYVAGFPAITASLKGWRYDEPVPVWKSFTSFISGEQWLTASFWQDLYGVVPLFTGSLLVSMIALALAVPLGIGAAVYVNQLASPAEQRLIKPTIEFISAIPSVVLGFFGIAVLGEFLRQASGWDWLSWFPGFPFAERLNALTAGCLLGLIAVPTIFTLAEDAINNVPRAFKEASYALGATRLQTIVRIIVPAALSGIISAVLLGLGRVIGETMVVLLCAGNRIAIPDFTAGLSVVTQPVHTMTGIIAQEMGEVVPGSIHYRALFVVGLLLFFIALLINFLAQKIVRKYKVSIG